MNFKCKLAFSVVLAIGVVHGFAMELKPSEIYSLSAESVVRIVTFDKAGKPIAMGSGVVVGGRVVVTNCHVVTDSNFIGVQLNNSRTVAYVIEAMPSDRCLMKTESPIGKPVRIAAASPTPGEKVYAIGHPKGLDLTISEGLISGRRALKDGSFLQISAPISEGSSGGALFNERGELVGVTTRTLIAGQNINFAAPVDGVQSAVQTAIVRHALNSAQTEALNEPLVYALPKPNLASPQPIFADAEARLRYLRWIEKNADRLVLQVPDSHERRDLLQTIWYEARRAGHDPDLIIALIQTLSQFRKFSVRGEHTVARGYMQVGTKWAKVLGSDPGALFHMQTNLRYGCVLLKHFLDVKQGDISAALKTYFVEVVGEELGKAELQATADEVLVIRKSLAN